MSVKKGIAIFLVVATSFLALNVNWQYEYSGWTTTVNITGSPITFTRSNEMILVARGKDSNVDYLKALGWMNIHDRYVQMCLLRLAAVGLLTKHLPFNEASLKIDIKTGHMNINGKSMQVVSEFDEKNLQNIQNFVDGINAYLEAHPRPIEFILFNYHPEPFKVTDVVSTWILISYAGLNDLSLTIEKMLVEIFTETDADLNIFKTTFSPHLDGIDDELIDIYKSLKNIRPLGDQDTSDLPKMTNSNNWVVSGTLSESGLPIMGADPHMVVSSFPNIFYEAHYIGEDGHKVFGISPSGTALTLMGRTEKLSWSLTFGMLDMSDYFVENIVDEQYERDGVFHPLQKRSVTIHNQTFLFYDTHEGHTIERSLDVSHKPLVDGKYLAARFALTDEGISGFIMPFKVEDVQSAQRVAKRNMVGVNMLYADYKGNIGYQQVGYVPKRTKSNGLLPQPAWKSENLWQGYLSGEDYHSIVNPPEGFIATANNHIQAPGGPNVATFSALNNRVDRIKQLLQSKDKFNTEDFKRFQSDTYSLVAERVVNLIKPVLGQTAIEEELRNWDLRSTIDSRPAAFFKMFHEVLSRDILMKLFHQDEVRVDKYLKHCGYFMSKIVHTLTVDIPSFTTQEMLAGALTRTLAQYKGETYGDLEKVSFKNSAFGGLLPRWTGVDALDLPTNHCSECIKVGVKRSTAEGSIRYISQAWRMVTDMSTDVIESILVGGPSGNILSNIYMREIDLWLTDTYKKIHYQVAAEFLLSYVFNFINFFVIKV